MTGSVKPFRGQDYHQLKRRHDRNNLFEDPLFLPNDSAMFYSQRAPAGIRWKRPKEVRRDAKFVVKGFQRCDMDQGNVGNCWFIAGCVGIMQSPALFAKVVPQDQSFDDDYAGIFHFRFWLYGEWVDVVVDDKLPFWPDGRLVYSSNKEEPNEFWAPLLEKAYAKLYGSYESLEGGQTTDALIDMSGGIEETFDLKKPIDMNLWTIIYQGIYKQAIMGCSIAADPRVKEARLANGLVRGHAYTITKAAVLSTSRGEVKLIRIRNPWGNEVEWKGAWSDNSREWNSVSRDEKEAIGLVYESDGEFWMSFTDFCSTWESLQICHLSADSFSSELLSTDDVDNLSWRRLAESDLTWKCNTHHSKWVAGKNAGGCGQPNQAKFWTNPQFLVTLTDVDHDDDEHLATVIIALMQKDSRLKRAKARTESAEEFIQFRLFKIRDNVQVDANMSTGQRFYANQIDKVGASGSYINCREVTKRFRVEPGHYIIIPSTYDADRECEFMLRIFTEEAIDPNNSLSLEEHKEDLTEEEFFFDLDDTDQLFSSWSNFLGEAGEDVASESNDVDESESYASAASDSHRPTAKEACLLM